MKLVSFNINGIQSYCKYIKDNYNSTLNEFLKYNLNGDIICFQEVRIDAKKFFQYETLKDFYCVFSLNKIEKQNCGVATYLRKDIPTYNINRYYDIFGDTGRVLLTDHGDFSILNIYAPCYDRDSENREEKEKFFFNIYIIIREYKKRLFVVGDLNSIYKFEQSFRFINQLDTIGDDLEKERLEKVLFNPFLELKYHFYNKIDLKNYLLEKTSNKLLYDCINENILYDKFNGKNNYTCWNVQYRLRDKNWGTRIDYILINRNDGSIQNIKLLNKIFGSDHCPIMADLNISIKKDVNRIEIKRKKTLLDFIRKK